MDARQVAVAEDAGIGVCGLQLFQQLQQGTFLPRCSCISRFPLLIQPPFVAHTYRMLVVAFGVGTDQLFVARLVGSSVTGDVVVVARESEAIRVTADEGCHGKATVAARGTAVNDNQIYPTHDVVVSDVTTAVSTVIMNWIMVFQRFMSLKIFIIPNY